jgi:glucose-1-phosphate adenylyltransferase
MTLYVFNYDFLVDILNRNARANSHEFGRDIIPEIVSGARVFGYKHDGYWAYARTVDSYYNTNMDVIKGRIALTDWQVRTNLLERSVRADRLPAYINGDVVNSVISEGCVVRGRVRNSILSPGVIVEDDADVEDSIIFHDTFIGKGTKVNRVICDKDSKIGDGCTIGGFGEETASREFGDLLQSGITLLGRNTEVPNKTRIGANTAVYSSARITASCVESGSTLR